MKNNILSALDEQFSIECEVIKTKYEYPNYTGSEKYIIITNLTEKELNNKYAEQISPYKPFIVLPQSYGEIRNTFKRNEKKHQWRQSNTVDCFNYEDGETECFHPELIVSSEEDDYMKQIEKGELFAALDQLNDVQRRRIVAFYLERKTLKEIGKQENVAHNAILYSIRCGLKNLKEILENRLTF